MYRDTGNVKHSYVVMSTPSTAESATEQAATDFQAPERYVLGYTNDRAARAVVQIHHDGDTCFDELALDLHLKIARPVRMRCRRDDEEA
jgi:hypothetical protein